jgi:hypothetical protein
MLSLLLWQRSDLQPVVIAVGAVALAALLWLYTAQLGRSNRRWRWLLPVLRAMVIVALAIAILKPVAARPKSSSEHGAVVFLVDQSRSMQIKDTGRTPAESMALAQGLGLLPEGRPISEATSLQPLLQNVRLLVDRVARAQSEAEYARLSGRGVEQARQRLQESIAALHSGAANLASSAGELKTAPELSRRFADLRRLPPVFDERSLRELRTQLDRISRDLGAVEERADAAAYESDHHIRRACDSLNRLSRMGLVQRAFFDPEHGLASKLPQGTPVLIYGFSDKAKVEPRSSIDDQSATGDQSDILGAVQSVRERLRGQSVQAIVLISDGREVGGDAESGKALAVNGPPVFAVGVASPHDHRDVSIMAIKGPGSAFVGESALVRVEIRALGCQGQTLRISLSDPDGRQTREITVGDATDVAAEFNVIFDAAGAAPLTAEVAPLPGEATGLNNRAERWVKVVDQSLPITVVSGADSRDYNAACDALTEAPWLSLRSFIVSGDADTLPLTPAQIRAQRVLVLMDVHVWSLSEAQWAAVDKLIEQDGGSVILEVADPNVLQEYEDHPIVSRLLPFDPIADVSWRQWPGEEPKYSLVEAAWAGGMPADAAQPHWPRLPAIHRYLAMPQLKPNAVAMLVDRDTGTAALAQAQLGVGRVFLLGTDETWRWQSAPEDGANHFWKPLVRDAAGEPYAVHVGDFSLDADPIYLKAPSPLHVRARVDRSYAMPTSIDLQIFRDKNLVTMRTLWPAASGGPGHYEATVQDLAPGQYELKLVTGDDLSPAPQLSVRVVSSSEAELADLSGDDGLLKRVAENTGGEFLTLDQLSSLLPRLQEVRERENRWVEYPLWDSPYLFLFVLSGLSLEWALRKQAGLA